MLFREQAEERFSSDLCHGIPDGHIYGAYRNRPLAMTTGLSLRMSVRQMRSGFRFSPESVSSDAGSGSISRESFADQAALPIASIGVETISDHALTVADDVGNQRYKRSGPLLEIDISICDRGRDRKRLLPHFKDAHSSGLLLNQEVHYQQRTPV